MYKLLLLLILIPALHQAQPPNLNSGLVAYYPFNGSFNDASGNGNNPSFSNAVLTADKNGNARSACQFNGSSQYIRIPNSPSLNFTGPFSVSALVKVNGFYSGKCHGNRIIMKGDSDYLSGNYFLTFDDNYYTSGANCNGTRPDLEHQQFYAPNITNIQKNYVVPGTWYRLTCTYDGKKTFT
jgi:hypothetical protein